MNRFAGICSLAVGLLYLVIGATHLMLPKQQLHFVAGVSPRFFESLATESTAVFTVHYWAFIAMGLLAVGVVLELQKRMDTQDESFVKWASYLAVLGFTVTAVNFVQMYPQAMTFADRYMSSDAAGKSALVNVGLTNLDPDLVLSFGAVGVWYLVINWRAYRGRRLPRWLAVDGLLAGAVYIFIISGEVVKVQIVQDLVAAVGALILIPVWYIGLGVCLLRESSKGQVTT